MGTKTEVSDAVAADDQPGLMVPIELGDVTLKNRVVMAPLTRNRAGPGNVPQDLNVQYYRQRAGAGLIISEATQISPQGIGYPHTPGIHNDDQVAGWRKVTAAVHAEGGKIFLQLWHVGRISHPSLQPDGALPVAPSAIRPEGEAFTYSGLAPFLTPRALEAREIVGIVGQYRRAAQKARQAGFDGVEIHAANGYLLDQFLRAGSNQRQDAYGGSVENRVRLLREVTEAVLEVWAADRVGVRLSPIGTFNDMSDSDPQATFGHAAEMLSRYGLAYLHVVEDQGDFDWQDLKRRFGGLYMANGGYDRERAERALETEHADLVSFGTLFIANPDLPRRFALDRPLNRANRDTFYGGDARGYTDYRPMTAAEARSAA